MTLSDLLSRTVKRGTCRLWTGATYSNGYGKLYRELPKRKGKRRRKTLLAHRVAYFLDWPTLSYPRDMYLVIHSRKCSGNKRCVNPQHLQLTFEENKMREWRARK